MDIGEGMRTKKKNKYENILQVQSRKKRAEEIKKGAHIDVVAICTSILLSLPVFNSLKTFVSFLQKNTISV